MIDELLFFCYIRNIRDQDRGAVLGYSSDVFLEMVPEGIRPLVVTQKAAVVGGAVRSFFEGASPKD